MKRSIVNAKTLSAETEILIRFSEVDSLGIAWHGNYIKYFEDGREAFGTKFALRYMDIHKFGFVVPIVKVQCDYKRPLQYGDRAIIETTYTDTEAAKIIFQYKIWRASDRTLMATGETIQVFLNDNNELSLTVPPFFHDWKKKWFKKFSI